MWCLVNHDRVEWLTEKQSSVKLRFVTGVIFQVFLEPEGHLVYKPETGVKEEQICRSSEKYCPMQQTSSGSGKIPVRLNMH
jgi:hypothetical protein